MSVLRGTGLTTMTLAGAFVLAAAPAHAYLDPGTGSYVFQMLAAALVTGGFLLKTFWRRLRDRVRPRPRTDPPPSPDVR